MQNIFKFDELNESAQQTAISDEVFSLLETDDYLAIAFVEMGISLKDSIPFIYHSYKENILELLNKKNFNSFGMTI